MEKATRRVVTGHDEAGRAIVLSDGPAPFVHLNEREPEFRSTDVWRTFETPAVISPSAIEPTLGPRRQLPNPGGTVFRINRIPAETEFTRTMTPEESRGVFESLGNREGATWGIGGRHPLMHRTETVDYALVLAGSITLILDDEEIELKSGDTVVQRGTNHAWANRSGEICVIAFILIDGCFEGDLKAGRHANSDNT